MATSNATLNIGNTTIGYSQKNLTQLKTDIDTAITKAKKEVAPSTSTAYKNLIQTLDNYWDGEDFDKFVSTLSVAATDLEKSIATYQKDLTTSLDNYATQMKAFQTKNASNMSNLKIN